MSASWDMYCDDCKYKEVYQEITGESFPNEECAKLRDATAEDLQIKVSCGLAAVAVYNFASYGIQTDSCELPTSTRSADAT